MVLNMGSAEEIALQLEGKAERLHQAKLQYEKLFEACDSFFWKSRVQPLNKLIASLAQEEDSNVRTLEHVEKLSAQRQWPNNAIVLNDLRNIVRLRSELHQCLKLRKVAGVNLVEQLRSLEKMLVRERKVPKEQRMEVALAVLAQHADEMELVREFATRLSVFSRTFDSALFSPISFAEWQMARLDFIEFERVLRQCWVKISQCDVTKGVERMLQTKSKVPQTKLTNGVEILAQATFLLDRAKENMSAIFSARLPGIEVGSNERFDVFEFLLRREQDASMVLSRFSNERNALLMLADEVSGFPVDRARHEGGWGRLMSLAQSADANSLREKIHLIEFLVNERSSNPMAFRNESPLDRSLRKATVSRVQQKNLPDSLVIALAQRGNQF